MKKLFTLTFILFSFFAKADYWTQKADFGGLPVRAAIGFSIGNKGYIGTGYNNPGYANEFWEYDQLSNSWSQKNTNINLTRAFAVGFSIGSKGYIVTGETTTIYNDCWEYDPANDTWAQKANFGGGARVYATGFSLNNFGYVGGGKDASLQFKNDFWKYDPISNSWIQVADFIGDLRYLSTAFADSQYGYVGSGLDNNGSTRKDFWKYDPILNSWSQIADIAALRREATSFTLNNVGYVGTGDGNTIYLDDFYQYNDALNTWIQKANFGGTPRELAVGFSIGNKGYIGTGDDGVPGNIHVVKTFWEYTPDSTTSIEELPTSNLEFTISPNPAKDYIVISYPLTGKENIYITITDAQGKKVYETKLLTSNLKLQTSNFSKGIYFVEVRNGKQKAIKKFIKE